MKLSLCALVLTLNLLSPQDPPVKVKCVMVNVAPFRLVCTEASTAPRPSRYRAEFSLEASEWPDVWIGRGLGGTYNAELRDGKLFAVETPAKPAVHEQTRAKVLAEMKRWRIPPTQQSGRP